MEALIINRFGNLGVEELKDCTIIGDISEVVKLLKFSNTKINTATA